MYTLLVKSLDRFCPASVTKVMIELSGVDCSKKLNVIIIEMYSMPFLHSPFKILLFDNIYLTPIQTVAPEDFFPPTF